MKIKEVNIQNFRSISKLKLKLDCEHDLITVCGANNVGKTNFLRALDLFFSLNKDKFNSKKDIPYHIAEGSRGSGYKTTINLKFSDENDIYNLTAIYSSDKYKGNRLVLKGKKNKDILSEKDIEDFIKRFRFILIESSNIDFSKKISELVSTEVLLSLDKLRSRQTRPLEELKQFIDESKTAVSNIEEKIGELVKTFVDDIEGIDPKTWKIKILFPEFNLLREAISGLIEFTLYDTNDRKIDTKGSGIQKILLFSIIDYISGEVKNNNEKIIIWGIDEPEAFLQPALQKKVFKKLEEYSRSYQIFLATHSQFFINLEDSTNLFLFEATKEPKDYKRKEGEIYYKINTKLNEKEGFEKILDIRDHFGFVRNDSWEVMPYNLLVEGEDDKQYFISLFRKFSLSVPNIFVAGGTDKMNGYLQFLNEYCSDGNISFKPKIFCILDHDGAGRSKFNELRGKRYDNLELELNHIPRCDGHKDLNHDYEIEDFLYPEVIMKSVNKFLKMKKYHLLKNGTLGKRFSTSYTKDNILNVFTELTKNNNSGKEPLNLDDMGIKKFIMIEYCKIINNIEENEFNGLNDKYPDIKRFIQRISSYS